MVKRVGLRQVLLPTIYLAIGMVVVSGSCSTLLADELLDLRQLQKRIHELTAAGRYKEAEPLARQMLVRGERSFGNRQDIIAGCCTDLGVVLNYLNRFEEAVPLHQRALRIQEKLGGGKNPEVAIALDNLANALRGLGRYVEAEPLFKRALQINETAHGKDHSSVSDDLVNLGGLYGEMGRYLEAEQMFKRSLTIDQKILGDEHSNIADSLNNLAVIYHSLGRYAEAEPLCKRALAIKQQALGQDHPAVAISLCTLANLYFYQGRYAAAEPLYKRALAIRETVFGEQHADVSNSLSNLAGLMLAQDRFAEAESLAKRAFDIDQKVFGDTHPNVAASAQNLASVYYKQQRYADAEPLYKRAIAIKEKYFNGHNADIAISLTSLANVYDALDRPVEAEPLFKRAMDVSEKALGDSHPLVGTCVFNLAFFHRRHGRDVEADSLVDRAIAIQDRAGAAPTERFQSYLLRARINWKLNRRNEALLDLRQSLDLAEQVRSQFSGSDKERAESFSKFADAFEQMIIWQLELSDASESLQTIERGHARSLLDEMNRTGIDLNIGRSASERTAMFEKEMQLKSHIAELEKRLERTTGADQQSLSLAIGQARNALYEQYRDEQNSSPVYRSLLSTGSGPPRLSQIQRTLLADDGLALVYLFGRHGGYLVVLTSQQVRLIPLSVDESQAKILDTSAGPLTLARMQEILVGKENAAQSTADRRARGLKVIVDETDHTGIVPQLAHAPVSSKSENELQLTSRLAALWSLLVPEAERKGLADGKYQRMIVIPDGPLALFPFETLVIEGGSNPVYLLDKSPPILYGPSLSVLYNLATRSIGAVGDNESVLSVADPIYDQKPGQSNGDQVQPGNRSRYVRLGGQLNRLPFTAEESRAVAAAFANAGVQTEVLERELATEAGVRRNVKGRRIVHLACHGLTDQALGNFFGALALTPGNQGAVDPTDDGFLSLPEIYALEMKGCELAILSACETNYGPQQQGEGVWTLSRGFLVSGARRVIASNWLVDDEAGAGLVSYFSVASANDQKQTQRVDYAKHLQSAKKRIRSQNRWRHPYYWGTFVFIGPR